MHTLKATLIDLIVLAVILLIITILLPSGFIIEKTIEINAPPSKVFNLIYDLNQWSKWDPWVVETMDHHTGYQIEKSQSGYCLNWISYKGAVGRGKLTIIHSIPDSLIQTEIIFEKKIKCEGIFLISSHNNNTTIRLTIRGELHGIKKWANLLMEQQIGGQFQQGFFKIKEICEK